MRLRKAIPLVAAAMLVLSSVGGTLSAQAGVDTESAARALVPLLKSVRQRLQPRVGITPGALPPSPFTGTQTAIVAVRIGEKEVNIEPKVRAALDRLLAWNMEMSPESPDAALFSHWLSHVRLKAVSVPPPGSTSMDCDTACAVARFTEPGEAFGSSRKAREEMRDQLLLDALIAAVDELEP